MSANHSAMVLWIDHQHAKCFELTPKGVVGQQIKAHDHGSAHDNHEKFFHAVAKALTPASEILVMGPGLAKNHFKDHLEKHHHGDLLKKVAGTENCDHPTDKEILAQARVFFKHYDMFHVSL